MNGAPTAANLMAHAAYRAELRRLLESLRTISDTTAIDRAIAFRRHHRLPCPDIDVRAVYLAGLHRAALRFPGLTPDAMGWSAHWLIRNGYSTDVDQVFAPKPEPAKEETK